MSSTDWEGRDFERFAGLVDGFAPEGMGGGYLGTFEESRVFAEAPGPTGDPEAPRFWGRWALDPDAEEARRHGAASGASTLQTFGDSAPVRFWALQVAVRLEPGAPPAKVLGTGGYFEQLRVRARATSADGFAVTVDDAVQRQGRVAGWMLYVLTVRVTASG